MNPLSGSISLLLLPALGALVAAVGLIALIGERVRVGSLWRDLRTAMATSEISAVCLDRSHHGSALSAALPLLASQADTITALVPIPQPGKRAAVRVAVPSSRLPAGDRATAALLASLQLDPSEVPDLARTIETGVARAATDITALLARSRSSLPVASYRRLLARARPAAYFVVPVIRGGCVVGLILALRRPGLSPVLPERLARAATRLALVFPTPLEAARLPARAARQRRRAPHGADLVLWLDAGGAVVGHERLTVECSIAPPRSLQALIGDPLRAGVLMQNARSQGRTPAEIATLGREEIEVHLIGLSDVDSNSWGYAALVRRLETRESEAITGRKRVAP